MTNPNQKVINFIGEGMPQAHIKGVDPVQSFAEAFTGLGWMKETTAFPYLKLTQCLPWKILRKLWFFTHLQFLPFQIN